MGMVQESMVPSTKYQVLSTKGNQGNQGNQRHDPKARGTSWQDPGEPDRATARYSPLKLSEDPLGKPS